MWIWEPKWYRKRNVNKPPPSQQRQEIQYTIPSKINGKDDLAFPPVWREGPFFSCYAPRSFRWGIPSRIDGRKRTSARYKILPAWLQERKKKGNYRFRLAWHVSRYVYMVKERQYMTNEALSMQSERASHSRAEWQVSYHHHHRYCVGRHIIEGWHCSTNDYIRATLGALWLPSPPAICCLLTLLLYKIPLQASPSLAVSWLFMFLLVPWGGHGAKWVGAWLKKIYCSLVGYLSKPGGFDQRFEKCHLTSGTGFGSVPALLCNGMKWDCRNHRQKKKSRILIEIRARFKSLRKFNYS